MAMSETPNPKSTQGEIRCLNISSGFGCETNTVIDWDSYSELLNSAQFKHVLSIRRRTLPSLWHFSRSRLDPGHHHGGTAMG